MTSLYKKNKKLDTRSQKNLTYFIPSEPVSKTERRDVVFSSQSRKDQSFSWLIGIFV